MAQGAAPAQTKEEKSVRADAESADGGTDAGAGADAASAIRIVIIPSLFPSPSAPAASSKKVFFFSLSCPRF